MCTDLPHAGYFIPGSCADMDTSQGAWIPAEKYFPDQDLYIVPLSRVDIVLSRHQAGLLVPELDSIPRP